MNDIPLLVVDQDRTAESRDLVDRFTSSGHFDLAGTEDTAEKVEPWLVNGRAQVALVIGAGYGEARQGGRTARVQVLADGTDSNSALVGLGYASRIVSGAGAEPVGGSSSAASRGPSPLGRIELVPRVWYNPDLKSRWFYVPAVLAMVLMLVTMMLPSMAVVREKEIGTLEQISVTPLRPWQLIVGKLVPFALIGLVDLLLIVGVARVVFGVPLRGSLLLLTFLTLLYLLNTLGLGLLTSTLVATQQQAMMFSVVRPHGPDDLPLGAHLPDRQHALGLPDRELRDPRALLRRHPPRDLPARLRPRRPGAGGGRAPGGGSDCSDAGLASLPEEPGLVEREPPPKAVTDGFDLGGIALPISPLLAARGRPRARVTVLPVLDRVPDFLVPAAGRLQVTESSPSSQRRQVRYSTLLVDAI